MTTLIEITRKHLPPYSYKAVLAITYLQEKVNHISTPIIVKDKKRILTYRNPSPKNKTQERVVLEFE